MLPFKPSQLTNSRNTTSEKNTYGSTEEKEAANDFHKYLMMYLTNDISMIAKWNKHGIKATLITLTRRMVGYKYFK